MVAIVLSLEGFEVRTARNGLQGCSSYFCNPADWIITDVEMPGLNGLEMARCIRSINPEVNVVYMSGAVDRYRPLLDREVRDFGAKVLRKPFTHNDLVEIMIAHDKPAVATIPWRMVDAKSAVKVA
jgi:two-component system response regulator YesN